MGLQLEDVMLKSKVQQKNRLYVSAIASTSQVQQTDKW